MHDPILDDEFHPEASTQTLIKERIRLWMVITAGVLLCTFLDCVSVQRVTFRFMLSSAWYVLAIVLTFGWLAGLSGAFIPYRNLSYSKKYIRASQWCMVVALMVMAIVLSFIVMDF